MKVKLRKRYYCDYCGKSTGTERTMLRHEKHCTANPNRVCQMFDCSQTPINELIDALKIDVERNIVIDHKIKIPYLRYVADGCPMCILSAIRQSGIKEYFDFDYKKEFKSFSDECKNNDISCWSRESEVF